LRCRGNGSKEEKEAGSTYCYLFSYECLPNIVGITEASASAQASASAVA